VCGGANDLVHLQVFDEVLERAVPEAVDQELGYKMAEVELGLSENWYDTSFPNEFNGPIAWNLAWLIKTKPEYVVAYRKILSGEDPNLKLAAKFNLKPFMPEFVVHRLLYGSFQLFIGELKIYRAMHNQPPSRVDSRKPRS
jgi:hypothetical protein